MNPPDTTKTATGTPGPHLFSLSSSNTVIVLISHAIPAFGVLLFGWDAFAVVFIFWLENAVIGFFTVLKILFANDKKMTWGDLERQISFKWLRPSSRLHVRPSELEGKKFVVTGPFPIKVVLAPFFCAHYGIFMMVHGAMIIGLLANTSSPSTSFFGEFKAAWDTWMWFALAGLFVGQSWDFFTDYLPLTIQQKTSSIFFFVAPYARIIIMHVVILAGAFFMLALGLPRMMALLLIALKTIMELVMRRKTTTARGATQPD